MKKYIFVIAVIMLAAAVAFTGLSNGKAKTVKEGGILSVSDIQADPAAFKGLITVTGVVARMHPSDTKVFAIIETAEAKHCQSTGCAKFYLPVQYEGKLPNVWDEVNITGSLVREEGFILKTLKVDILQHLKSPGGQR